MNKSSNKRILKILRSNNLYKDIVYLCEYEGGNLYEPVLKEEYWDAAIGFPVYYLEKDGDVEFISDCDFKISHYLEEINKFDEDEDT